MVQVAENRDWLRNDLPGIAKDVFDCSFANPSERIWFWLHYAELRDYLAPEPKFKQAGTGQVANDSERVS